MTPRVLHLPPELAAAVLEAATRSFPAECCGLIEGTDTHDGWLAQTIHEGANLADDPGRQFLIDPELQFKLLRHLRGAPTRIIGCFHSHPKGPSAPSRTDADSAYEDDFIWLIAGGSPASGFQLGAWWYSQAEGFSAITVTEDVPRGSAA
jgi:proteasome lid subunit RPN8/RPN11